MKSISSEDNHRYFYPPEDSDDYWFDVGNEHEHAEDVDPQSLIKLVKFLKKGKGGTYARHHHLIVPSFS